MPKDAPPNGGALESAGPVGSWTRVSGMQAMLNRWAAYQLLLNGTRGSAQLVHTHLISEDVLLAMPGEHPDAGPSVDLAKFSHHDWVLPHERLTCHEMVIRACAAAGFTPRPVASATDFAVQLALVRAGVGVALVPGLGCTAVPVGVSLHRLRTPVRRHISFATRVGSRSDSGLSALRRAIAENARRAIPARGDHL